jgi:hypothetical protein
MTKRSTAGSSDPVAQRLRLLWKNLDFPTSGAFAAYVGLSAQRFSNFENGLPLSRDAAFKIVQRVPGVTLDWLYFGKADGLPLAMARRLEEV